MDSEIGKDIEHVISEIGDSAAAFRRKTALVTGGSGFVGSYLCESLSEAGANVVCVDNLSSGMSENLAALKAKPTFKFIKHDISEPLQISGKVDFIFHLASLNAPPEFEQYGIEIIRANTFGTYHMLRLAEEKKAAILFVSSSEVYGDPSVVPTPETYIGKVNTVGPRGPYDESKRCGEVLCFAFRRRYGTKIKVVRPFNVYGPRQRWDDAHGKVVGKFIWRVLQNKPIIIYGSGQQTRSFIYISDFIAAFLKMMAIDETDGEVVNIGSRDEISMIKLAKVVIKTVGNPVKLEFAPLPKDEPTRRCPDISKAKKLLRWQPKVPIEEGLKRTADWLKKRL